jgi:hypothetical protein
VRSMSDRVTFRKMIQATVLLMAAGISYAGTIVDLAPEADAILVGSITSRMESDEIVSFTITVDRILKGQGIPTVIHVEHPGNGNSASLLRDRYRSSRGCAESGSYGN